MTKIWTLPLRLEPAGGPFDDPALLVAPTNADSSILFDCGTLHGLKTRDLQKVQWLFLSHLHIDHLIGFDHLLRVRLFSSLRLTVYGPPGTLEVISHRLKGFAWNLTSGSPFVVRVFELSAGYGGGAEFACHHQFDRKDLEDDGSPDWPKSALEVRLSDDLSVKAHPVHHGVPCLAYRLKRSTLPKFSLEKAQSLGLRPGPWVRDLIAGKAVCQVVDGVQRELSWLASRLLEPPLESSLGFLTDTRLDQELAESLIPFFGGVDVLCCETAYLESEAALATQNLHMTTSQAATLARQCQAGQMLIFHLSRRHCENGPERHLAEVQKHHSSAALLQAYSPTAGKQDRDP